MESKRAIYDIEATNPENIDVQINPYAEKIVKPPMRLLEWWYRFTAPSEVATNASLAQRELVRRGRLGSIILLGMQIFLLASLPIAIFGNDHSLLWVLLPSLVISIIVLQLNRMGKIMLAGIVLVGGFELGYIYGLLVTPGGLGMSDLPRFDLLIEPVLLAVSFLPPRSVYLVALGNSLFIWADLTFMPHTAELGRFLATSPYTVLEAPIALQIIVAFVVFLWVRSANRAIQRADRAETIAALEHTIAEQKRELEVGVQQILHTHVQVANGDFDARAPLTQENMLWQIANSLNTLLARFQRLSSVEQELRETKAALFNTRKMLQEKTLKEREVERRNGMQTDQLSSDQHFQRRDTTGSFSIPLEDDTLRPFFEWKKHRTDGSM